MKLRFIIAFSVAAVVVIGTSAWTIREVGKNNRAILNLGERIRVAEIARNQDTMREFEALNARVDRLRVGTVGHEHSDVRHFVIAAHLAQVTNPIVFLGDSITEAAVLPRAICGHLVVNAGIGGAAIGDLVTIVPSLLHGVSPVLVVIAIGTNDAYATPGREEEFSASYIKLLQALALITPRVVVANIPPVDPKGPLTVAAGVAPSLIDQLNLALPKISEDAGASLVDLNRAVGAVETVDGVHLSPRAYVLWNAAMFAGVTKALDCPSVDTR